MPVDVLNYDDNKALQTTKIAGKFDHLYATGVMCPNEGVIMTVLICMGADLKTSNCPAAKSRQPLRVTIRGDYAQKVRRESSEAGLQPSEIVHRAMERAALLANENSRNQLNGQLQQITSSLGLLKLRIQRADGDGQAALHGIEEALKLLPGMIALIR